MLRRRHPPLLTLPPAPTLPPPPPRPQQPPDLQLGRRSSSTLQYCKRLLQHCRIIKVRFGDYYEQWMNDHAQYDYTEVEYAVEAELKRYNKYYTVSMIPTKPLHVSEIVMPEWKPHLENAFMWLGEWRPSAIFTFLLLCHDNRLIRLPPHNVALVKELLRVSHANETILDEELAACQAMSPILVVEKGSLVKEELGRNVMRMTRVVAKAQHLRFEAIEAAVKSLVT